VAIARFMNEAPKLTESNIGYALDNLKVNSQAAATAAPA